LALLSVALGQFMVVVDVTILNIALPSLASDLHADLPELEWALIAYGLTMVGLVPIFGRISDVLGRKRLYVVGLAVFSLASALAAASPVIEALILARILQAVGGALITSNTLAILTDVFPPGKRGVAMGVQSILISGGAALGPVLGGFLVTSFGWEAVFLVNLPIGAISALMASVILPPLKSGRPSEPLDWIGAAMLLGGLVATLMALTRAPEWGWTDVRTLLAIGSGLPLLALFVRRQLRVEHPLVKPSLFRIRPFVAGQIAGFFATASLVSMVFMLPFYWQVLRGLSAREAGLLMLPIPLSLGVMAPISGRLSDRFGSRGLTTVGLTIAAIGCLLVSRIDGVTPIPDVLWRLAFFGLGLGLFLAPNNNATMSAAPAEDRGVAAGLLALFRFTGQAIGIAGAGTLFLHASGHVDSAALITPDGLHAASEAALVALRADFVEGYRTVCLAAAPVALLGALLSFSRGSHTAGGDGGTSRA
jgi:EmrB/QacA subfamily drug resistance transporter